MRTLIFVLFVALLQSCKPNEPVEPNAPQKHDVRITETGNNLKYYKYQVYDRSVKLVLEKTRFLTNTSKHDTTLNLEIGYQVLVNTSADSAAQITIEYNGKVISSKVAGKNGGMASSVMIEN